MSTLADFNNNPGNIRPPKGVTYEGQIGVDDNGFAIFENKKYGKQALINDVQHKLENGLNTPSAFIDRYAPGGDNSQESRDNYKIHLADKLGLNSTGDPFPEKSHEQIADAIAEFESGVNPQEPSYTVPPIPNQGKSLTTGTVEPPKATPPFQISEPIATLAGGVAGATAGSTAAVVKAKLDAAHEAYDALQKKVIGNAQPNIPETGSTPGGRYSAKTGYGVGEGTVEDVVGKRNRLVGQGKITSRLSKMYGVRKPGESPDLFQRMIDRKNAAELAQSALPEVSASSKFWPYLKGLAGMPVKGAIYGAGTAFGAADAYNRASQGDKTGASVATVGALSPLLAPFIASGGVLPAIGGAAPLYLGASDRIKHLQEHPEDYELDTNEYDPMGNRQR